MTEEAVSDEASKRICAHMNDDHAATVHAFALATLSSRDARCKVQNAKLKSVSLTDYCISYTLCDGDFCAMKKVSVPFQPPLAMAGEVRPRLIQEHHKALAPKFTWLVTNPMMRMLFGPFLITAAGAIMGQEELALRVDETPWAPSSMIETVFVSSNFFAKFIVGSFYFGLVAHAIEAVYTSYLCKTKLKMTSGTTLKWFVLNLCTGFPVMNKVREFVQVDNAARAKKKNG